jgi:ABC-type sugar transport system permease subunit
MRIHFVRITALAISLIILAYLLPVAVQLLQFNLSAFTTDQDGLNEAWLRSVGFALGSSLFNLLVAMLLAVSLQGIPFYSNKGKILAFLLIPVLLGNVSIAFMGKLLFTTNPIFHTDAPVKFAILLLIQFWQFGLLYTYLFWLILQNIPQKTWEYAEAAHLSKGEKLKDIILPAFRNLAMLLFILNFIFSVYEEAKIQFIFKASRGTNTEMISQWLNRHYQTISLLNVKVAIQNTLQVGSIVLIIALCGIVMATYLFNQTFRQVISRRYNLQVFSHTIISKVVWGLLILFVVLPLGWVLLQSFKGLQWQIAHLIFPLAFTALAALIATLVGVLLGILWRLGWQQTLSSFNNKSLWFFIFLFFLQLLPPIGLLITGFQWLRMIGYQNEVSLYGVWLFGHLLLVLPLLSSFLTVTHFQTTNKELDYLQAYNLRFTELIKTSFLQRFAANYVLTFLIAFSMVWNEAVINNLLSDFIPSFVNEMKMSISGRGADYAKGMTYFGVSIVIAIGALLTWGKITNQQRTV